MLTDEEFIEFVDAIKAPITPKDIMIHKDIIGAQEALKAEAMAYAERVLIYFEKKRNETCRNS